MSKASNKSRFEYFRPNVGLIVVHPSQPRLLWCRRKGGDFWQFPQGGIDKGESPQQAARRELQEETGLEEGHVRQLSSTERWYRYRLPKKGRRFGNFAGQEQQWFLYQLCVGEEAIQLDHCRSPEFDSWQWVSYWYPLGKVVEFKRDVYRQALLELAPAFQAAFAQPAG